MNANKPKTKAKASSRRHPAAAPRPSGARGAASKEEQSKSGVPSEAVIASQANEWFSRHQWGSHKQKVGWRDILQRAKTEWQKPEQDLLIAALHKDKENRLPPDEINAAVRWECFRHLYFSGELSDFWRDIIEGDQIDTLEKHYPKSLWKIGVMFSHEPNDFASPWAAWANNKRFPKQPWSVARKSKSADKLLFVAVKPSECVVLLTDYIQTWALAEGWARHQIEEFQHLTALNPVLARDTYKPKIFQPAEIPCTGEKPERAGSENITRLIVEVDWDSTKGAIVSSFERQIEPLWKKRNPDGKKGRGDTELPFFSGLAMRRRMGRGILPYDACQDLYEVRADTEDGRTGAAQNALELADRRLAETKASLEAIEDKLRQN